MSTDTPVTVRELNALGESLRREMSANNSRVLDGLNETRAELRSGLDRFEEFRQMSDKRALTDAEERGRMKQRQEDLERKQKALEDGQKDHRKVIWMIVVAIIGAAATWIFPVLFAVRGGR